MRAGVAFAVCALSLCLIGPAAAKNSSEGNIKRASVMRAKAKDLRDQANHLRDGEGVTKPNVSRAVKMEKEADALERQANSLDPQDWPPKDSKD